MLAYYQNDYTAGMPAFTVNAYGKGKVYYIAAAFEEDFYTALYGNLIRENGLRSLDVELPTGVYMSERMCEDNVACYIIQNYNTEDKTISLPREMTLLETGEKLTSFTLPAYGTTFLV